MEEQFRMAVASLAFMLKNKGEVFIPEEQILGWDAQGQQIYIERDDERDGWKIKLLPGIVEGEVVGD